MPSTADKLRELGWEFFQTGPDEGQWLKWEDEDCIAQQGDEIWEKDLAICLSP